MKYIWFLIALIIGNIIYSLINYLSNKRISKDNIFSMFFSSVLSFIIFVVIALTFNLSNLLSFIISSIIILITFSINGYKILIKNEKIKGIIYKNNAFNDKFEKIIKYVMIIMILVYIVITICNPNIFFMKYPLDYESFNIAKNPYALLFEGLNNGHLYLNVKPDESLLALENPYGYRGNAIYLWDYCFYNEKYYVYFGVAPVILFYFPIYFLSFANYIPTYIFINYFCLIIASGYSILTLYRFYKHFSKNFNVFLFIICCIAMFAGGGYFLLALAEPMYNTPLLVATTAMFIMYYNCIKGIENNNKLSFAIMSLSFIIILSSRPNLCFCVFPLLVLLLPYLFNKNFKKSFINLLPCFITLFIGVVLIGLYNYFRFGSFVDFGANYQLTVSDVSKNQIKWSNLLPSYYYYFFQKPIINDKFPYILINLKDIKSFELGYYVYTYPTIGLFTIPLSFCMFLGLFNLKDKKYLIMNIIFILNILVLAFVEFSLAGVHLRYMMDLLPMVTFISLLNILIINELIKSDKIKFIYFVIILIVIIISIIMFISLNANFSYDIEKLLENFTMKS